MGKDNYMFDKLKEHVGHSIVLVGYGDYKEKKLLTWDIPEFINVSIECLDCNEVLIDYDKVEDE